VCRGEEARPVIAVPGREGSLAPGAPRARGLRGLTLGRCAGGRGSASVLRNWRAMVEERGGLTWKTRGPDLPRRPPPIGGRCNPGLGHRIPMRSRPGARSVPTLRARPCAVEGVETSATDSPRDSLASSSAADRSSLDCFSCSVGSGAQSRLGAPGSIILLAGLPGLYAAGRRFRGWPCEWLGGAGVPGGCRRFSTSRTPATLRTARSTRSI
jgi:hypothetical protein